MTLECRRSNLVAQNLYHKLGFVDVGFRKRYYADTHEDALVMAKEDMPEGHPEDDPMLKEE
jgi:ribosomal-protein-alanine N-acetyltransferase